MILKKTMAFVGIVSVLVISFAPLTVAAEAEEGWQDFQIRIDGQLYDFPMMYDDFVSFGWRAEDAADTVLRPEKSGQLTFESGDLSCTGYVVNLGINTLTADACIMGGISIDSTGWDMDEAEVALPGDIIRGQATVESIQETYGAPSEIYEKDSYTRLYYEIEEDRSLELTVYKDSGVLEDIELRNFVEPEGFDPGEPVYDVPELVADYKTPEYLSDELTQYQISLEGCVYALPVPVQALVEDSWEIDRSDSDAVINSGTFGWITLRKEDLTLRTIIVNEAEYATGPDNCWIEELETGGYILAADGALSGGIRIGMTEDELIQLLEDAGAAWSVDDESEYFTYYTYNQNGYGQYCEVTVYKSDDGDFEQYTVIGVACGNAFQ